MTRRYFGTDGIRGLANSHPMTSEVALKSVCGRQAVPERRPPPSRRDRKGYASLGYMLEAALMSGFTSVGMDVFLLGPMPTPAVAMLTRSLRADLGVMISASHNRYDDNGIKLFDPDGYKLRTIWKRQIETLIDGPTADLLASADKIGRATRVESAQERYIEFHEAHAAQELEAQRPAHRDRLCQRRGLQGGPRSALGTRCRGDQDRRRSQWPQHQSQVRVDAPDQLIDKVREVRADIGIALDGDADRVVIVDEKGQIVDGDQLMAVIAESWHRRGKLSGGGIVATVMSNLGLERHLKGLGLTLARTPVGDRYVVEHMRKHGFNVGGEQSGHIVLSDFTTTGDGLFRRCRCLPACRHGGSPFLRFARSSRRCRRSSRTCAMRKESLSRTGGCARPSKAPNSASERGGRLVIRPSGTEPSFALWRKATTRSSSTRSWATSWKPYAWRHRRRKRPLNS